jgi:hypothetical protein
MKKLPNGWRYCLSYQVYLSSDMICYEGNGVPADIEVFNNRVDIENGIDPLIVRGLEVLRSKSAEAVDDPRTLPQRMAPNVKPRCYRGCTPSMTVRLGSGGESGH